MHKVQRMCDNDPIETECLIGCKEAKPFERTWIHAFNIPPTLVRVVTYKEYSPFCPEHDAPFRGHSGESCPSVRAFYEADKKMFFENNQHKTELNQKRAWIRTSDKSMLDACLRKFGSYENLYKLLLKTGNTCLEYNVKGMERKRYPWMDTQSSYGSILAEARNRLAMRFRMNIDTSLDENEHVSDKQYFLAKLGLQSSLYFTERWKYIKNMEKATAAPVTTMQSVLKAVEKSEARIATEVAAIMVITLEDDDDVVEVV